MSIARQPGGHGENKKDHAVALLDASRKAYDDARLNRLRYMRFGRQYGMTYAEIGEILGISATGVRMALKRADVA